MAKGKPTKWATATVVEPIHLGKAGIEIVIWDKYKKTGFWLPLRFSTIAPVSATAVPFSPP